MSRSVDVLLEEILLAIDLLRRYTDGLAFDRFVASPKWFLRTAERARGHPASAFHPSACANRVTNATSTPMPRNT